MWNGQREHARRARRLPRLRVGRCARLGQRPAESKSYQHAGVVKPRLVLSQPGRESDSRVRLQSSVDARIESARRAERVYANAVEYGPRTKASCQRRPGRPKVENRNAAGRRRGRGAARRQPGGGAPGRPPDRGTRFPAGLRPHGQASGRPAPPGRRVPRRPPGRPRRGCKAKKGKAGRSSRSRHPALTCVIRERGVALP